MPPRRTPQTAEVLAELLSAPRAWSYGYDISRSTGLKSGTLYPLLIRLTEQQLLETKWAPSEDGRPPRHLYRLTANGVRLAREWAAERPAIAARQPAFGVGGA